VDGREETKNPVTPLQQLLYAHGMLGDEIMNIQDCAIERDLKEVVE